MTNSDECIQGSLGLLVRVDTSSPTWRALRENPTIHSDMSDNLNSFRGVPWGNI